MSKIVDVNEISQEVRREVRVDLAACQKKFKLVGFLASEAGAPSRTYASYAQNGAKDVGIEFELIEVPRVSLEARILQANDDPSVHGIMVYYPVFGPEQDNYIKDLVDYRKDVEGLNVYWARKIYGNNRCTPGDSLHEDILPCTPLAIIKILEKVIPGLAFRKDLISPSLAGKTVTIFNRSEVVGRPLAAMLSHLGARVYSFDEFGPLMFEGNESLESTISRVDALIQSSVIIGGVPSKKFKKIEASEISSEAVCLNFSSIQNFSKGAQMKTSWFVPRVGPVTISMLLRNGLRLRRNFEEV